MPPSAATSYSAERISRVSGFAAGERLVGPLHDRRRARIAERGDELAARERPEGRDGDAADGPALRPQVVDDGDRGVGDRAHRDEDLAGALGPVRVDGAVARGPVRRAHSPYASSRIAGMRSV